MDTTTITSINPIATPTNSPTVSPTNSPTVSPTNSPTYSSSTGDDNNANDTEAAAWVLFAIMTVALVITMTLLILVSYKYRNLKNKQKTGNQHDLDISNPINTQPQFSPWDTRDRGREISRAPDEDAREVIKNLIQLTKESSKPSNQVDGGLGEKSRQSCRDPINFENERRTGLEASESESYRLNSQVPSGGLSSNIVSHHIQPTGKYGNDEWASHTHEGQHLEQQPSLVTEDTTLSLNYDETALEDYVEMKSVESNKKYLSILRGDGFNMAEALAEEDNMESDTPRDRLGTPADYEYPIPADARSGTTPRSYPTKGGHIPLHISKAAEGQQEQEEANASDAISPANKTGGAAKDSTLPKKKYININVININPSNAPTRVSSSKPKAPQPPPPKPTHPEPTDEDNTCIVLDGAQLLSTDDSLEETKKRPRIDYVNIEGYVLPPEQRPIPRKRQ